MVAMDGATSMSAWLAGLDRSTLAGVLANRPDVLLAPEPRSLAELAQRLSTAESLVAVLRALPRPGVQLAEAALALGGVTSLTELSALLAGDGSPEHGAHVEHWLQILTDHAIAWRDGSGDSITTASGLDAIFPSPLALGPPLRVVLAAVPVDGMRRILLTLGVPKPPARRDEVLAEALRVLGDPETVRGIAQTAPSAVTQELLAWAAEGERSDDDDDDDESHIFSYDPAAYPRRRTAATWALERGLVFGQPWSYGWQLPAEICRALRGPAYRAPFDAVAPAVDVIAADRTQLVRHSAAEVSRFAELVLALVDRLARTPLPALKSGGVGARELAKLGNAVGCAETELRLALALCAANGVLARDGGRWVLSAGAEQWRSLAPAQRVAAMLTAWWHFPSAATQSRDSDDKTVPALTADACPGCLQARHNLLHTMAELPHDAAGDTRQIAERALWRQPFVHVLVQDAGEPFASIVAEATALGLIAAGALTPLGQAVLTDQQDTVHELLTAALPPANDRALFGADLTVVVPGTPTAPVSRLLDAAADRESRGGATVWRFTPGSIRRALDEGRTAADLERDLAGIATTELPQPLRYLIGDVGRRHGNLRIADAVSVVRSEDAALLQQVVADRALRKLGLRLLAPTVLAADADVQTVLSALRKAGYLPMPESDAVGEAPAAPARSAQPAQQARPVARIAGPRAARERRAVADPDTLAARLLARPGEQPATASSMEQRLSSASRSLSSSQLRILAHAVESGGSVLIEYESQAGKLSRRVIIPRELTGDTILAWCELRGDERWFRIDRISSVAPVG